MSLNTFLNTFNNVSGQNVYKIDPVKFFTVDIQYVPENTTVNHANILGSTDISLFIQSIELPSLDITADTAADTLVGSLQTHKMYITPANQTFKMSIINTKHPLFENWLYPWLREVTYPQWQYENHPYTTAKIFIDFREHSNVRYVLNGCRPTSIETIQPTNEVDQKMTRNVTFTFDYIYMICDDSDISSNTGEHLARSVFTKAAKTIGL